MVSSKWRNVNNMENELNQTVRFTHIVNTTANGCATMTT